MDTGPLVVAAALAVAALAVAALGAVLLLARGGRARPDTLADDLARSRADVEALSRRVTDLAEELRETRRVAAADREHVITSLGGEPAPPDPGVVEALLLPSRRPVPRRLRAGRLVEQHVLEALSRRERTRTSGRLTGTVVRAVAFGHGVRRALSPDNLDRAAAEAHVARRRSRRTRRKELRDARRLLRSVKAQDVA